MSKKREQPDVWVPVSAPPSGHQLNEKYRVQREKDRIVRAQEDQGLVPAFVVGEATLRARDPEINPEEFCVMLAMAIVPISYTKGTGVSPAYIKNENGLELRIALHAFMGQAHEPNSLENRAHAAVRRLFDGAYEVFDKIRSLPKDMQYVDLLHIWGTGDRPEKGGGR